MSHLSKERESGLEKLPFVVLLDEANLSPMEYYWADFMNVCDDLKRNNKINFNIESYSFQRERFLISFVMASQLYELYSLTKIIACLHSNGYEMTGCEVFPYQKTNPKAKGNTEYPNTFVFKKNDREITVYYQPFVYCEFEENGIELYRNTSYSYSRDDYGNELLQGAYYNPDIILKCTSGDVSKYFVIDSKFRNEKSIRHDMSEYVYKYIFSFSTSVESASLVGLCLFSGKEFDKAELINIRELERKRTTPYQAWILPLTETCSEKEHFNALDAIIDLIS